MSNARGHGASTARRIRPIAGIAADIEALSFKAVAIRVDIHPVPGESDGVIDGEYTELELANACELIGLDPGTTLVERLRRA